MRDEHAVKRAVEMRAPEIQKVGELGEARRKIVILPEIALQKLRMVRQSVENFRRRERVPLQPVLERRVCHGSPHANLLISL